MFNWMESFLQKSLPDLQEKVRPVELVKRVILVAFVATIITVIPELTRWPRSIPSVVSAGILCLVYATTYWMARRGHTRLASFYLISVLWIVITIITFFLGGLNTLGISGYIAVIIIANLLLGNRALTAFFVLSIITYLIAWMAEFLGIISSPAMPGPQMSIWVGQLVIFIVIGLLVQLAFRILQNALDRADQNARVLRRRAVQIQTAAEVARDATAIREMDHLLSRAVDLIHDRFGFYYAAIFINDEHNEHTVLRAAVGETGQRLLEAGHRLKIGEAGIVGHVAASGKSRIALDVGQDAVHIKNPLLPDTRSEMALPLIVGIRVMGVLDVQSQEEAAFDQEDIAIVQTMADQLAVAVETARLFEAAQRQLRELTVLHAVATASTQAADENALIERATQVIGEAFYPDNFGVILLDEKTKTLLEHPSYRDFVDVRRVPFPIGVGITGKVTADGAPWRVPDVSKEPAYVATDPRARSELCVPIKISDRVIGVINAESTQLDFFTEADERLLSTLAGQLATGIQRARLYKESQGQLQELEEALERLQELDHLKSEFIQNVSHELRTPVTIVLGYAEMFAAGELGDLSPEQDGPLSIMIRRLRALNKLLDDMLTIIETEAPEKVYTSIDLAQLVYAVLPEMKGLAARAGLQLEASIAPDLPQVRGVPTHLLRACENLFGNAVKFTPAGGSVHIQVQQEGNEVALEVSDTGIGIPGDQLERVFDRFYQIDGSPTRRYGGIGLGLALVKEVVEAHGGGVSVQSTPGKGSKFRITLPVTPSQA